jgi:hypothetical protein
METKVLTQEEITRLKEIQLKRISLTEKFGLLEVQLQEINSQKHQLSLDYQQLRQLEEQLGAILQQKYGDGTINLEKGEFISG